MLFQYSSLHEFQYDSHWPTLGDQYGNHIEMSANCYILTTISNLLYAFCIVISNAIYLFIFAVNY